MYKIEFSQAAGRELKRIYAREQNLYLRLIDAIGTLRSNPYRGKALKGKFKGDFSLRVGGYRVIYTIQKNKLIVYIIDLGQRREIYR